MIESDIEYTRHFELSSLLLDATASARAGTKKTRPEIRDRMVSTLADEFQDEIFRLTNPTMSASFK